ncbi:MAG: hypothetical protein B6245_11610 [Desulfobacteraceae bacterium 4572_88]|nr:MAG: hypothetical protein B6245_11610 [Desulfobacteraceae bacterium 4572_88]
MFSVRTTMGSIFIIATDTLICYLLFGIILPSLAYSPPWLSLASPYGHGTFIILTLVVIVSMSFTRLYSFIEYIYPIDLLKRILPSFAFSFGTIATMGFFIKSVILLSWRLLLPLIAIYICLAIFRFFVFFVIRENRERILILGISEQAREIIRESHRKKFRGYEIIGIVTSFSDELDTKVNAIPILGLIDDVQKVARNYAVDSIVITLRERRKKLPLDELLRCKVEDNVRVQEGLAFYEKVKRKIIIDDYLKKSWFIFEEGFFHTSIHGVIKRTQGIIVSSVLLVLMAPVLLVIAILIRRESPGPVFFTQERVGRNGRPFFLRKFRSMYVDAEKMTGPVFAQENDPRVTRIGRIIRKTRLDEFPQFINIFKGDMDLVGPRPERPVFVKKLEEDIPHYKLRHAVRPGLTGWAQVNYPYGDSFDDSKEKLTYDLYYVKHFSWYLDLLIILLTIKEVIFSKGR